MSDPLSKPQQPQPQPPYQPYQPYQPQQPQQYMPQPQVVIHNTQVASASAAVIVGRRRMGIGMHLFLTFITGGLWAFTGWPYMALRGR